MDWAYRKEINFDLTAAGADISGPVTDVPVLIRLSLGNFPYFNDANPDGSDLRFIGSDDKTPLKFHVEKFDSQTQMALLWVRLPALAGGAKTDKVYLYYGNKKAKSAADPGGSYDTNQALVYHFIAGKGSPQDSTAYKSEPSAFNADALAASLIGGGAKFSGAQTVVIPANGAVHMTANKGFTMSAWVRFASAQSNAYVAQLADAGHELVLGINGNQAFARFTSGVTTPVTVTQGTQLTNGEWHHLAVAMVDGHMLLVVDGADVGHADAKAIDLGGALTIGGAAANTNYLTADVDELEVSNAGRSADWLKAAARSQGIVAPLVIYAGDSQRESGGQSYFATTLKSVTIDGWVIIGILAVMFLLSLVIMVSKGIFLARVAGGNSRFMKFRAAGDDLAALEHKLGGTGTDSADIELEDGGKFGVSTIWPLYHHGMRETLKRMAGFDCECRTGPYAVAAVNRSDPGQPGCLVSPAAATSERTDGIPDHSDSRRPVPRVARHRRRRHDYLRCHRGLRRRSTSTPLHRVRQPPSSPQWPGLGSPIPCLFGYTFLTPASGKLPPICAYSVDEFVARIAETHSKAERADVGTSRWR